MVSLLNFVFIVCMNNGNVWRLYIVFRIYLIRLETITARYVAKWCRAKKYAVTDSGLDQVKKL